MMEEKVASITADAYAELDDEIGLQEIREIEERSYTIIERLREKVFAPDKRKQLKIRFSVSEAAEMVGRTAAAIRDAEKSGRLPSPELNEKGRRVGYRLEDVNRMRAEFGTQPWRGPGDEPVILAIQNFKGGVGKSTIACHTGQYLALQGYRVCVIDCDSQGSTTTMVPSLTRSVRPAIYVRNCRGSGHMV